MRFFFARTAPAASRRMAQAAGSWTSTGGSAARSPLPLGAGPAAGQRRSWASGSLLLALVGCAAGPPAGAPPSADDVEVPAGWSVTAPGEAPGAPLARWWLRFDDPVLDAFVTAALQANTSIRTAQAALRQAQALRDAAAAALWPTLGAAASAQQGTADGRRTGSVVQVGATASWVPDVFGAGRSALQASRSTVQASVASLGDEQRTVAAEVALSYILVRSGQARLVIADANLTSEQETLQITQWRQQAGLATLLDVDQAGAAVEQTRALVPAQQAAVALARHALAVLDGRPPAALDALLTSARAVPQVDSDFVPDIPAETLRQRADVRAAEYRVSAAWARVAQADAARFPGFALSGSLGSSGATLGALTHGATIVGALLASVSVPLLDAGAARAEVRAQQAAFEQARLAYQATVLAALQDVEDALAALRGDRARLISLRSAAAVAADAAQLARQQFASGLVDFQTVLLTQRTQLGTQDGVAGANADVSADQVRLFEALGGGWREDDSGTPASAAAATRTSPP